MGYDDAYALLLTHEARLKQNQSSQAIFNAYYSLMNANFSHIQGNFRRGSHMNRYSGQYGGRSPNTGKSMFFIFYLRGFPTASGNFGRMGRGGQFGGLSRGQNMQVYRGPSIKHMHPSTGSQIVQLGDSE